MDFAQEELFSKLSKSASRWEQRTLGRLALVCQPTTRNNFQKRREKSVGTLSVRQKDRSCFGGQALNPRHPTSEHIKIQWGQRILVPTRTSVSKSEHENWSSVVLVESIVLP
jgi:hypothetical protein